jgi:hypothetical protein
MNFVIALVRQAFESTSSLACWSTCPVSRVLYQASTRTHSVVCIPVRALLLCSRWCWETRSGVNSTSTIHCRSPFFNCYRCCRHIALFQFRQDFVIRSNGTSSRHYIVTVRYGSQCDQPSTRPYDFKIHALENQAA